MITTPPNQNDEDQDSASLPIPTGAKNYMTMAGYASMKEELLRLIDVERPEVVKIVSWAASNGDRSENGDYIYGKRRLREIDRRIRFLTKRLDIAEVVDPRIHHGSDQVFLGATVKYETQTGVEQEVTIVGIDEIDPLRGKISWVSPMARALNKAHEGDTVLIKTPGGIEEITLLKVSYPA